MMCPITGILDLRSGGSFGSKVGDDSFAMPRAMRVIEITAIVAGRRPCSKVSKIPAPPLPAKPLFDASSMVKQQLQPNQRGQRSRRGRMQHTRWVRLELTVSKH
jgi:hypothetical protein